MNFKDLNIKVEYKSLRDDIVSDFYTPLLSCAKKYQRAVGFFSSSALIEISDGISGLVKNGGTIELVASPKLSEEDVNAISEGLKRKDDVIRERLIESITAPKNDFEKSRLNYMINLIACGVLEIKIAVLDEEYDGMYHEKVGLMFDEDGNIVAFSGSMNESITAFMHNYESIDVFKSWVEGSDPERVENKRTDFTAIWGNYEPHMSVVSFPKAAEEKLFEYRVSSEVNHADCEVQRNTLKKRRALGPAIPDDITIRDYQERAIIRWAENNYVGIFDMATGAGKTITGLAAAIKLYKNRKAPLAIFITCPYQHLVNQWIEDIERFGLKPIVCHSASIQKNWRERLKDECLSLELGVIDHMCAIFVNATYTSEFVQSTISHVKNQALLVVDEAHNFGAENASKYLDDAIPFRLALSATLERYGDDAGTQRLFDFFGEKCIEYTLKQAIDADKLVRYYYYPIVVSFNDEELEKYLELSRQISKAIATSGKDEPSDYAKMLLIKRARLVAAAQGKIDKLIEEIKPFSDSNHMLVYCGATTVRDVDYCEGHPTEEDKKQVDVVVKALGNKLNMRVAKFTSEESAEERERIKQAFDEGEMLQALVAIRCLDEGVNIPSIDKAFILASSTNPKEYIQRRGRVLRKHSGKTHSKIYDFVMSPLPLENIGSYDDETINLSKSLVKREIVRMRDFASIAENTSDADDLIFEMIQKYGIDLEENDNDIIR